MSISDILNDPLYVVRSDTHGMVIHPEDECGCYEYLDIFCLPEGHWCPDDARVQVWRLIVRTQGDDCEFYLWTRETTTVIHRCLRLLDDNEYLSLGTEDFFRKVTMTCPYDINQVAEQLAKSSIVDSTVDSAIRSDDTIVH